MRPEIKRRAAVGMLAAGRPGDGANRDEGRRRADHDRLRGGADRQSGGRGQIRHPRDADLG